MSQPTSAGKSSSQLGLFARIRLFFKQVAGELRKVVRPSRKELVNLFVTVLVFVAIIMLFVSLLDLAFSEIVFRVFG